MIILMVGGVRVFLYSWKTRFYQISSMNGINTPSNSKVRDIFGG
jgi:hypothetical protein